MRRSIKGITTKITDARFSYLFFTIILLFLLRPFLVGLTAVHVITDIFMWSILISCGWAVYDKKRAGNFPGPHRPLNHNGYLGPLSG